MRLSSHIKPIPVFITPFVFIVERCTLCDLIFASQTCLPAGREQRRALSTQRKNITALCFFFLIVQTTTAQVRLPRLIRDSMILQRASKINIWGWASKNEKIRIKFNGKNFKTTANTDGKWLLQLPAMKAGGPYHEHCASNLLSLIIS